VTSHGDTSSTEPRPWRLLDVAAAVGGGLAASVFAAVAAYAVSGDVPDGIVVFRYMLPAQALGMLAVVAIIARRRPSWRVALRWSMAPSDSLGVLIGAGLQIGLVLLTAFLVEYVLRRELQTQEVVEAAAGAATPVDWAVVFLAVVVLGPVAEEVVFRGVALRALERRGKRTAVWGSAALFALVHLLDPRAIYAVPFFFVLGVILGNEVIRTGRLGRAITIHAGFNLVTMLALIAASVAPT
jgi:uncharacterized protein